MYYYLYKITNQLDGKIYIGCHQTKNLEDGYLGSGKYLKRAIKKHGKDNFKKEILKYFDNKSDMYNMESIIVNEDFIDRRDTYNLREGGKGGFINEHQAMGVAAAAERRKNNPEINVKIAAASSVGWNAFWDSLSEEEKSAHTASRVPNFGFTGKTHSAEARTKMSRSHKGKHKGKKNSQYGTCWIYSSTKKKSIKIKKTELDKYIKVGWCKGRKIKF